jgi:hypothetical protein
VELDKCECSGTHGYHTFYCSLGASVEKVTDSMKRDPERWIESYVERNTQSVRLAVVAQTNGRH